MKLFNIITNCIPQMLDLPDQTLPGIPIIEIYGNQRVLVDGKCRVTMFDNDRICLKSKQNNISVLGTGLRVAELSCNKTVIFGCIDSVSIHGR